MNLFRSEVLSSTNDWSGPIVLPRPWSSWVIVSVGTSIGMLTLAYLVFGTYTKHASVRGILLPAHGVIRISSQATGIITERRVSEGEQVNNGDILFVLSDERRTSDIQGSLKLADAHAHLLEQRRSNLQVAIDASHLLNQQTQDGLRSRLNAQADELTNLRQEIEVHTRRVASAENIFHRQVILAQNNFISPAGLLEKEDQVETLRIQLISARRKRAELTNSIASLRSELSQVATRAGSQIADLRRQMAELLQESAEVRTRDRLAITAPLAGTVTAITAEVGQLASNQPIATILPRGSALIAQLFAPSRVVGFVKPGQRMRLRYQAYPYEKFGQYSGTVIEVSRSPISPLDLASNFPPLRLAIDEGVYRITVKVDDQSILADGKNIPLMPGMTLDADIEQEKRRLYEWIFFPVIGVSRRLS
ncbi:HlyD family secretion protein [Cupriavidus sp. 2MCAB6]|uniref:HlyD family secretion protein n=1 Tax=Cupriavidus sp. 2MCAB6 TaxID=3232981 RepID=UPI003F8F7532